MHFAPFLDTGSLAVICVLGGPFMVAIIYIVSRTLENIVRQWREVSLKSRMVDAGMSAAEIEQVVMAGQSYQHAEKVTGKPAGKHAA